MITATTRGTTSSLLLLLLLPVWWGASAWNSICARQVASPQKSSVAVSIMAATSNLLGVVLWLLLKYCSQSHQLITARNNTNPFQVLLFNHDTTASPSKSSSSKMLLFRLALAHAVGLHASYMGLTGAKVAIVQAVKALEPVLAMALSAFVFGQYVPPVQQVASGLVVVVGVLLVCVHDTTYTYTALLWVSLSSVATQLRNQFMKQFQQREQKQEDKQQQTGVQETKIQETLQDEHQHKDSPQPPQLQGINPHQNHDHHSKAFIGLLLFVSTSALSFPINVAIALSDYYYQYATNESKDSLLLNTLPWQLILQAGFLHFLYNLASFGVLALVSPATHSLANTAKRAIIIGAAAVFLRGDERLSSQQGIGLLLVIVGFAVYQALGKKYKNNIPAKSIPGGTSRRQKNRHIFGGFLIFLLLVAVSSQYLRLWIT